MKVIQDDKFQPVTITLENEEEFLAVLNAITGAGSVEARANIQVGEQKKAVKESFNLLKEKLVQIRERMYLR